MTNIVQCCTIRQAWRCTFFASSTISSFDLVYDRWGFLTLLQTTAGVYVFISVKELCWITATIQVKVLEFYLNKAKQCIFQWTEWNHFKTLYVYMNFETIGRGNTQSQRFHKDIPLITWNSEFDWVNSPPPLEVIRKGCSPSCTHRVASGQLMKMISVQKSDQRRKTSGRVSSNQ